MTHISLRFLLAALLVTGAALAEQVPSAGRGDARIRNVAYDADQVVRVMAYDGYEVMVQFADGERIENVALGDSLMWQVTPNKRADLLFVKSVNARSQTNMTVVTDRRVYHFLLVGSDKAADRSLAFAIRFRYPPGEETKVAAAASPAEKPAAPPQVVNAGYTYSGADGNVPEAVFDDGRFTYLKWPSGAAVPAIFTRASDDSESLVQTFTRDGYVVVDRLCPLLVLRNGGEVTVIRNEKLIEQQRSTHPGLLASLFGE